MKENGLTLKQENFCQAYVNTGIASAAYRSAYDCANMKVDTIWQCASRLLAERKVAARIKEIREENERKCRLSKDEAANILAGISSIDPSDIFKWDEEKGKYVSKDISELPKHVRLAIKKVKYRNGVLTFEFYGKTDAMKLLAEMNGWEAPKEVKLSGDVKAKGELRIGFDDEEGGV
jgi:phage terminase small subunit